MDAVQPNSPAQQAVKSRFSTTAAFWDALTDPQKQAWKTYAATLQAVEPDTKTTYKRTGYNVYSGYVNVWLAANGSGAGTPPTAPPSASYPTPAMAITAAATASTITLSSQTPTPSGTVVEVWLQRLKNASRTPAKNGYRVKTYAPLVAGKGSASLAVTVTPGVYAAAYSFVNLATGQRSARVEIAVAGVALALERGGADDAPASKPAARKKAA